MGSFKSVNSGYLSMSALSPGAGLGSLVGGLPAHPVPLLHYYS